MFYFLVFHTSISASKTIDKKILTTLLYGSILYLILHGFIKTSDYKIFSYIAKYYWTIIGIDIATLIYLTWDIIDYPSLVNRFIDTSGYSLPLSQNSHLYHNNNDISDITENTIKPILRTKVKEHEIKEYQTKKVAFEDENETGLNGNDNYTAATTVPQLTTAEDMGLSQSTSLDELGIGLNDNDNKAPEGMNEFFSETIDVTDHVSNISDIEEINLDDFASNLN